MALIDFLKNTATITRQESINDNWIVKKTTTTIYTNIPCYIYNSTAKLDETNLSENTQLWNIKMLVEANKTNIKKGDLVLVNDPDLWTIWNYQINFVKMNRLNNWNDSIELTLSSI